MGVGWFEKITLFRRSCLNQALPTESQLYNTGSDTRILSGYHIYQFIQRQHADADGHFKANKYMHLGDIPYSRVASGQRST